MRSFIAIALFAAVSAIREEAADQLDARPAREEQERPTKEDIGELAEACGWLAHNVDWEPIKELEKTDAEDEDYFQEVWGQIKDTEDGRETGLTEDDAREVAKACVEIDIAEREDREEKGEEELPEDQFFAACQWLAENVSEEAFENEDWEAAWESVKDSEEAAGWTPEAAQEVAQNCLFLAKAHEEDEGTRPQRPRKDDDKDGEGEMTGDEDHEDGEREGEERDDSERRGGESGEEGEDEDRPQREAGDREPRADDWEGPLADVEQPAPTTDAQTTHRRPATFKDLSDAAEEAVLAQRKSRFADPNGAAQRKSRFTDPNGAAQRKSRFQPNVNDDDEETLAQRRPTDW